MNNETIHTRLEDIVEELKQYKREDREEILHQEIDRNVMYFHDAWLIIQEERPSDFRCYLTGELLTDPSQLAYSILLNAFYLRFGDMV
jgi:hypothetical protein